MRDRKDSGPSQTTVRDCEKLLLSDAQRRRGDVLPTFLGPSFQRCLLSTAENEDARKLTLVSHPPKSSHIPGNTRLLPPELKPTGWRKRPTKHAASRAAWCRPSSAQVGLRTGISSQAGKNSKYSGHSRPLLFRHRGAGSRCQPKGRPSHSHRSQPHYAVVSRMCDTAQMIPAQSGP